MAVRIAKAPDVEEDVPAAAPSRAAQLAVLYRRTYRQYDELHEIDDPAGLLNTPRRSVFRGVMELAASTMHTPPASLDDVTLQLALAASWCDLAIADLGEDSLERSVGLAIESALQNATRFLCEKRDDCELEGEVLDILNDLYAEAVFNGAEIAVCA